MPGSLVFKTSQDQSSGVTPQTVLTLDSSQNATFAGDVAISKLKKLSMKDSGTQKAYIELDSGNDVVHYAVAGTDLKLYANANHSCSINHEGLFLNGTRGIQFGTNNAANTLDDYEEGTWEPTITSGSTVTSYNGGRTGRYTKTGRIVTCHFNIGWSGTANGDHLKIGNLPFTDADVGALGGGQVLWTSLPTLTTSDGISLLVSNGTTTIECYDGVNPNLTIANTTSISSKVLYGIVTYEAV